MGLDVRYCQSYYFGTQSWSDLFRYMRECIIIFGTSSWMDFRFQKIYFQVRINDMLWFCSLWERSELRRGSGLLNLVIRIFTRGWSFITKLDINQQLYQFICLVPETNLVFWGWGANFKNALHQAGEVWSQTGMVKGTFNVLIRPFQSRIKGGGGQFFLFQPSLVRVGS